MPSADPLPSAEDAETRIAKRRVGQRVADRFQIEELLGLGGMAAVYAATDEGGRPVALKILRAELSLIPESKQRFLDEGYLANRVGHPGAVSISEDGVTEDGSIFLVMDRLRGEPLDQRLSRTGPMDAATALHIADGLLDILARAHDSGIVHRDVKPGNVFLTQAGEVKLLDFGVARILDPGRPHLTEAGVAMGTPAFMAPEQARGHSEELDGRTDLWSVGATMFIMLSGRQVHTARTLNEELLAAMTEPAPSLATAVLFAPQEVVDLVDRALAFEKERRFADARSMQAEVRRIALLLKEGRTSVSARLDTARTLPGIGEPAIDSTQAVAITSPRKDPAEHAIGRRAWQAAGAAVLASALVFVAVRAGRHAAAAPPPDFAAPAAAALSAEPIPAKVPELTGTSGNVRSSMEVERRPPKGGPRTRRRSPGAR
jgi:eukaryotic-like serine/threonine-protein kinase